MEGLKSTLSHVVVTMMLVAALVTNHRLLDQPLSDSGQFTVNHLNNTTTFSDFTQEVQGVQYEKPPRGGKGWMPGLPLPKKEEFDYLVEIHFLIVLEQAQKYPKTYDAFLHAISIWGQYLPITVTIRFDTEFELDEKTGWRKIEPRMYKVYFGSMEKMLGTPSSQLGGWIGPARRLYLDDVLEKSQRRALSVAMHELGHAFGLPHMVGEKDLLIPTLSGDIRLPKESSRQRLMFPFEMPDNKWRWKPSPLEVRLAKKYVKSVIGTVAPITGINRCDHCSGR